MSLSVDSLLQHMLQEMEYLLEQQQALTLETFLADETYRRAFVRSIEILGEASKQLPEDFRNRFPQIPWREIAGMRDRLIHAYFAVDYEIVWDVVENKLATLHQQFLEILRGESDE